MEIEWKKALIQVGEEIMINGGRLEFIVYKRDKNKRKPVIHKFPDNEVSCKEEILID